MKQLFSSDKIAGKTQYIDTLVKRTETSDKFQSTRHQQDAIETITMFQEKNRLWRGKLFRIFKQHRFQRNDLIKCRDWCMKKGSGNIGALFVSTYQKFLAPFQNVS